MSDRNATAAWLAELAARSVRPVLFFEGEFASSQFLRLWTGLGTYSWDGKTWTGGGHLLEISPLGETTNVEAIGFSVTVSGMPSANVSIALQSLRQGKPGKLWLGFFDAAGALIANPYLTRQGKFDIAVIEDDGTRCTISAQYESRLVDLLKPRERRYTAEDQKIDHPADLGFDHVPQLQDMELIWGGPGAAASPVAAPSDAGAGDSDARSSGARGEDRGGD